MSNKSTQKHHVLMGDVTGSSKRRAADVAQSIEDATKKVNSVFEEQILSPLTVTLGDEFQGVIASASATFEIIKLLQDRIFAQNLPPLHFSWVYGNIDTPINPEIAHGMLGPALTTARKNLTRKDRDRPDIQVDLSDGDTTSILQNTLFARDEISSRWKQKDAGLIKDFKKEIEVKYIAERHDRDTSSIYRRRETLMIDAYLALTQAASAAAHKFDVETGHI